jgi:NADPH2:quinone reductase
MRHVMVRAYGGPDQLSLQTTGTLVPGPGQLLVEVEAAGVNFLDIYQRKGQGQRPLPFALGLEGVGRVIAVGDEAASAQAMGQRVAWIDVPGSYASHVLVPAERAIPVPDSFTLHQALLFQPLTAQYLAAEYRDVRPGDAVLVHAAAGGVGQLLVQMLKRRGAWVVGTTSSEAKAEVAREAGADVVINYGHDYAFLDALKAVTNGRGVDLAFDSVGAATLANTLKGLARGGTVVSYGSASGPPPAINPMELIGPCTRVAGGSVFTYVADPAELQRRAAEVVEGIRNGWLRLSEGTAFTLDHATDAHRAIEGRGTKGKLFLTP